MDSPSKRQRGRPRAFNPPDGSAVQSLDRGLSVLSTLAGHDGLSLSEVAAESGLPPSTTYRMLTTLEKHGLVAFDPVDQLWAVGVEAFRIGSAFLRRRKLVDQARQVMQDLVDLTGETANLGVAEDDCVVFVSQVETHQAIRAFFRPGTRSPYHASGIGKAVLSLLPEERVRAILRKVRPEAFTPTTLSDEGALLRDLETTRRRGWSLDDEERFPGMRCVAAPIVNEFGEPVGGVSVSGPTIRITPERAEALGPIVSEAAARITAAIGGAPRPSA